MQCLVNGTTLRQEPGFETIVYYQVELDRHDVLLAEALAVESYLDTGSRTAFDNSHSPMTLHPDFLPIVWGASGCAPLVMAGPASRTVQNRRAAAAATRATRPLAGGERNALTA